MRMAVLPSTRINQYVPNTRGDLDVWHAVLVTGYVRRHRDLFTGGGKTSADERATRRDQMTSLMAFVRGFERTNGA